MIGLVVAFLPLALFSTLAFWKENVLMFMLSAGASMIIGLGWYASFRDYLGLGMGLLFVGYSIACLGFGFGAMFKRGGEEKE